ncbi:tryptophan synthase subunit alpha [bacterium]|nr:tryptophan synthase subunit alpha [bacterium]
MSRIKNTFENLKKNNQKALGIFLTAGDPNFETSMSLFEQLPNNGVDFIEIGMPFSDPMADGPAIQLSSQRALKSGMNLQKCLNLVKKFREKNNHTPIILMGYYNPIYKYGKEKFVDKAIALGVDGLIIVDLPPEEDDELYNYSEQHNLSFIRLITPTTKEARLAKILKNATGFIYYVSITGITGTQTPNLDEVSINLKKIKSLTELPTVIGFGIRSAEQAQSMSSISDGIVVGSAVVDLIKSSFDNNHKRELIVQSCMEFVSKISKRLKHN